MIDNEIKELFKEIAEMQRKTDAQFKERGEAMDVLFKQRDSDIKALFDERDRDLKALFKERDKATDALFKERDRITDEKLNKLSVFLGNIGKNQGDVAEEFFFNTIKSNLKIGNVKFNDITPNLYKERDGVKDEYDIFLTNGDSVAIIEVKYKAHENDIEKLKNKKIPNFRKLFPIYKDYKIYAGLAGFNINKDVVRKAEEYGFFILKRKGELVEFDTEFMTEQFVA